MEYGTSPVARYLAALSRAHAESDYQLRYHGATNEDMALIEEAWHRSTFPYYVMAAMAIGGLMGGRPMREHLARFLD